MGKLSEEQSKELKNLKERSLLTLDFIEKKSGPNPVFDQFKAIVKDVCEKKNLRSLKIAAKDINQWSKGLSPKDRDELNKLLNQLEGLEDDQKLVNEIVAKGEIKNDEEYSVILERIEEIHSDSTRSQEAEKLNNLLIKYHQDKEKYKN